MEIAFLFSGLSFSQLKHYDQAIQVFKQAERVVQTPKNKSLLYSNLGSAYYQKQNYKAAIPYLKEGNKDNQTLQMLYDCYLKTGDKQQAEHMIKAR